jgi:hypothetical protein
MATEGPTGPTGPTSQVCPTCPHVQYLEVRAKAGDRHHVSLKQQTDPSGHPLEKRPPQSVYMDAFTDPDLAQVSGYMPKIPALGGGGDTVYFRVCTKCHRVIGFPDWSTEEWANVIVHVDNGSEDDD